MPRILIAEPEGFTQRAVDLLNTHAQVQLTPTPADQMAAALDEYDVVWLRLATRITGAMIANAKRCRVIATPVTGLDHIDLDACAARGVRVVSLKGEVEFLRTVRATAELTLALMLNLLRHVSDAEEDVRAGRWNRDAFRGRELFGKTVAIVGAGRLGTLVAGFLKAFGADVVGYDTRHDFPEDAMRRAATLEEALLAADIVTVHVSLNESTRRMFDANAFSTMKTGAFFVNTARGDVVDESALIAALESGRLAGAALDVLSGEPHVDATHRVVQAAQRLKNLQIVPHIGGNTYESFEKTEMFLAGRVLNALRELSLIS